MSSSIGDDVFMNFHSVCCFLRLTQKKTVKSKAKQTQISDENSKYAVSQL